MQRAAFKVALSAIAVAAAFASTAHAAGFMLTEQSAGALGRAYAGAGVDGTDLSGVYYNPATMVLHKGTAIQMGFVGIGLNLDYVGEKGETANGRNKSQAIPHGYIVHQINDKAWFGLSMTVPFGMGTEYDDDWAGNEHGISATILTFDLNPNFAFKLSEKFSVGFGASIQYASADLKIRKDITNEANGILAAFKKDPVDKASVRSEIDADSIAWGWNVGMMWSPLENLRFGVSYRSKITHDAEGDLSIDQLSLSSDSPELSQIVGGTLSQLEAYGDMTGAATVTAPAWAMASVAWDVNDLVSLYGTFRWTDWSSFDELKIDGDGQTVSSIPNKWRDTYLGSLGMDLRLTDWWTLRGGIAYESSPIANPQYRTAIIPDADRWWFAIGSSFKWSDNFQTDISFAHLHGVHERNIYGPQGKEGRFRKLDAYLLGAQLVYKF